MRAFFPIYTYKLQYRRIGNMSSIYGRRLQSYSYGRVLSNSMVQTCTRKLYCSKQSMIKLPKVASAFVQLYLAVHWRKRQQLGGPNCSLQQNFECWSDPSKQVDLQFVWLSAGKERTQTCGYLYSASGSRSLLIPFLSKYF